MALVIPPGFAEVSAEVRNVGDPDSWFTTWGIDATDAGGDFEAALGNCRAAFLSNVMPLLALDTTCVAIHGSFGSDGGPPARVTIGADEPGGTDQAMLPQNCAALVDKFTGLGGRQFRGRMFVPNVLVEGQVDSVGTILGTLRASLQGGMTGFLGDLTDGPPSTPMVVLHNEAPGLGVTPAPTLVTSLVVQPTIATQRRRLRH